MLVTVFCAPRDRPEITFSLDVSPELEVRDFVALCELESGIPAADIQISYAQQPLQDPTRALGTYGLKDGDVVVLRQAERRPPPQPAFPGLPRIDFSSIAVPGTSSGSASSPQGLDDPSLLRDMLLANPHELSLLKERNPPLAEALLSGDLERFTKVLLEQQQERARREQERIRLLTADPFDLDAQAKIEEDIRQHNIEENMTIAMEEAPESFGQVVMLYINCKVNGHPVKAFVDSGAQMTIMSQACAERCNIMRLVDRRWAGIAKGVGTQKIIGRVHLAQVQIEGDFLPCSFSILEDQPMDMLLGLDMLKRHQCSIDLKKSVLLIGTTGSETRFLPEAELPECARLAYGAESREDTQPEEIADRELAEALQRSVQESDSWRGAHQADTQDGRTTSPPVPPYPLSTLPDKTHPMSSSCPGHPQNPALDRAKSAPATLPHLLPQESTASGSSQSQPPFQGFPVPAPPPLATLEIADPEAPSQAPPPKPDPSPSHLPDYTSLDLSSAPEGELTQGSLNMEDAESNAPIAMEVGAVAGGEGTDSAALPSHPQPGPSTLEMEQKLEEAQSPDAKSTHACLSADYAGEQGEKEGVEGSEGSEMEGVCGECPCTLPLDAKLDLDVNLSGEHFAPEPGRNNSPSSTLVMDSPADAQAIPQSERDQPEGERQPNCDTIPSLAAALMELHELLVSNSRMLPREGSPSPTCREDADGGDGGPITASQFPTLEQQAQPATATAERSAPESENAAVPLPAASADCEGSPEMGEDGQGEAQCPIQSGESEVGGKPEEDMGRGFESEPEVASPPHEGLEFREPPEGRQGRGPGVADGRAAGPDAPPPACSNGGGLSKRPADGCHFPLSHPCNI
ncbi:hypothetical protein AAFF_G00385130 [Aldrovandia affinis]|uniref:Ubiquitin-like domain-containing protein n=1 Tax=Aldrovandia affinis TaxID=143900 RepID=A0AAD7SEU2_9TELE|nr:hypothetical protein AAFF_G00385130 [Aldrovandia affinis]